jgi:hypothetical protein
MWPNANDPPAEAMPLAQFRARLEAIPDRLVARLCRDGTLVVEDPTAADVPVATLELSIAGSAALSSWPFASGRPGDAIPIRELRARLDELEDHLVVRLGGDGKLHLAHPTAPQLVVANLDLTGAGPFGPWLEQLESGPRLIKEEVTSSWEEFEFVVGPTPASPSAQRGPFLLTFVDDAASVDLYHDAHPADEGAEPTRELTAHDIDGGCWYVEQGEVIYSERLVRIRGRFRPLPGKAVRGVHSS